MRLIRLEKVMETSGLRSTSIYNLIAEGKFPKQVKLTSKSVAWVESEVQAWVMSKIEQRDMEQMS